MSDNKENNRWQLIDTIKNLEDAFIELEVAWSLEGHRELMEKAQNESPEYPFHKSFDELSADVSEWSYWMRKGLGFKHK